MNIDSVPLSWYLTFSTLAFIIGLFGVLIRRNPIATLMALEVMLNAVSLQFVAWWRWHERDSSPDIEGVSGVIAALVILTLSAAEIAVGVALVLRISIRIRQADLDLYDHLGEARKTEPVVPIPPDDHESMSEPR